MPSLTPDRPAWGVLPLLVDTSAWARARHAAVRDRWVEALLDGRMRITPTARHEILFSARGGKAFDTLAERLTALRPVPLTPAVFRAAEDAMRALAHRSDGTQRIPIADYHIAAAAQEIGAAVIHYDGHFDTLAEVMAFDSVWLAPRGSLP
jgi:predicted nucleic acid-binding protein